MAPKRKASASAVALEEVAKRAALEPSVSQWAAARILQPAAKGKGRGKGTSLRQARRKFSETMRKPSQVHTPYGKVVKELQVETDSGTNLLEYICPFVWLFFTCSQSQTFARLLMQSLQGLPGRICIYSDDVQPGNVLRPDRGRTFIAVY